MSRIQQIADGQDWTDKTLLTLMLQYIEEVGTPLEDRFCEYLESCCEPESSEETKYCQDCGEPLEEGYDDGDICQACIDDEEAEENGDLGESVESVTARISKLSRAGCVGLLDSVSAVEFPDRETDEAIREALADFVMDNTIDWYSFDEACKFEGIE